MSRKGSYSISVLILLGASTYWSWIKVHSIPGPDPILPIQHRSPMSAQVLSMDRATVAVAPPAAHREQPLDRSVATQPGALRGVAEDRPDSVALAHDLRLTLTDEVLLELENEGDQLRALVGVSREPEGWRVHFYRSNPFSKVGLQDGDLITTESIESQLNDPKMYGLAVRLVAVLNRISSN